MVLAIVQDKDTRGLMEALVAAEFQATKLASTGGFLREGNATVLIGTEESKVEAVLAIIQKTCHVREQLVSPLPPVVEPVDSYIRRLQHQFIQRYGLSSESKGTDPFRRVVIYPH